MWKMEEMNLSLGTDSNNPDISELTNAMKYLFQMKNSSKMKK